MPKFVIEREIPGAGQFSSGDLQGISQKSCAVLNELGTGIQFFFPYFIFSPEFKMSNGISNTLLYDDTLEESTVLEKVLSRTFTISLHFEG